MKTHSELEAMRPETGTLRAAFQSERDRGDQWAAYAKTLLQAVADRDAEISDLKDYLSAPELFVRHKKERDDYKALCLEYVAQFDRADAGDTVTETECRAVADKIRALVEKD